MRHAKISKQPFTGFASTGFARPAARVRAELERREVDPELVETIVDQNLAAGDPEEPWEDPEDLENEHHRALFRHGRVRSGSATTIARPEHSPQTA